MGGRRWQPEEDAVIRSMVAEGTAHDLIADALGRTVNAVRDRAQNIGARMSPEHAKRNNVAGNRAMHADPTRRAVKNRKITASYTPERRAQQAECARKVNATRVYTMTEETKRKLAAARLKHSRNRLAWLPDERRGEYVRLVHRVGAAEAKRRILADMTPFERQLAALRNGARLIEKPILRKPDHDFTLGGVTNWSAA